MGPGMFDDLDVVVYVLVISAILGVTLGLWKLVEIVIWLFDHLHWS